MKDALENELNEKEGKASSTFAYLPFGSANSFA